MTDTALVLLHGFPLDGRMWDRVREHLSAQMPELDIMAPTVRGCHKTQPWPADYAPSLTWEADRIAELINQSSHTRAVVVGLSMGGYIAQALAAHHPQIIAGMVLMDTNCGADSPASSDARLSMATLAESKQSKQVYASLDQMVEALCARDTFVNNHDVIERAQEMAREIDPGSIAWIQRAMAARPNSQDILQFIGKKVPSLVIRGAEDPTCTSKTANTMAEALGCDVVNIPSAGHFSAMEQPQAVAKALEGFLRQNYTEF
ncbi:alpha/beta fold hydrolase [Actinomyces vulturis]|uniref:alpha/beta fold hydrolase n=1 Tax=Actinomyces vulturis TaxID=1857645 RepID=UPI000836FD1F|nr:alpha/beta hydrolase [Actinomyces vulturis]